MEASDLYHCSGIVVISAGVLNVIAELLPERLGQSLDLLVNTLGLWVLAEQHLRQRAASGVFPKWAGLLLMIGFVMAPIGAFAPHIVKSTGEVILSAGLIGLSYALASGAADTKQTRLVSN